MNTGAPHPVRLRLAALLLALLSVVLRFFTTVLRLADEPTSMWALRARPGWSNESVVDAVPRLHWVIFRDENGLIGEGLYEAFVGWGWLAALALALVLALWRRRR